MLCKTGPNFPRKECFLKKKAMVINMSEEMKIPGMNEEFPGEIKISNDVIAIIAGMALCDLEGVLIGDKLPIEFIDRSNAKNIARSIKIDIKEGNVFVNISVSMLFGINIQEKSKEIQAAIKNAINTMTGLNVVRVDVTILQLTFKKDAAKGEAKK